MSTLTDIFPINSTQKWVQHIECRIGQADNT